MRLIESISTVAKWAEREAAVYEDAVMSGDGEQEELGDASNGAADGDDWVGFYLSQDLLSDIRNDEEAGTWECEWLAPAPIIHTYINLFKILG